MSTLERKELLRTELEKLLPEYDGCSHAAEEVAARAMLEILDSWPEEAVAHGGLQVEARALIREVLHLAESGEQLLRGDIDALD
jgi:hypothetical protein